MKDVIIGFCVAMAVIGFEIATGLEMSFGARVLITIPLTFVASIIAVGEKR